MMAAEVNRLDDEKCRPRVSTQENHLEELRSLKDAAAQNSNKMRMVRNLCRLLNKIVPIYLPESFHTMSCFEMHKNYPNGDFWSKASLFLVGNTHVNHAVWDKIQKEEPDDCFHEAIAHPLLGKELRDTFKDDFQVSDADREHACGFNSWVLQQIPMCPSMMYQWWLSSSYYLLKLETHLADFYHLKFPQYLQKTIQGWVTVVEKARFYLNLGLHCMVMTTKHNVQFKVQHYEDIISAVTIVLHYYCRAGDAKVIDAIKCLKRMCWSESSAREVTISPGLQERRDLGEHPCLHDFVLPLWDKLPASLFMREQLVACTGCTSCKEIIQDQKLKEFEEAKKISPNISSDVLKFAIDKFLMEKQGTFRAEDKEALLRHADDPEIWKLYYLRMQRIGFLGSNGPLDEADKGPFCDVLILTRDLEQANLEAALIQRLSTLSGIKSLAVDCEGPDMTLEEIEEVLLLSDIELEPPWTFAIALEESQRKVDICKETYEHQGDSIAYFQYQIKSMVLKIAENSYASEKNRKVQDHELRFNQYLLPCFLASYFDLKEDKRVSLKARNFYLNFIKHLLKIWDEGINCEFFFKDKTVCFLKWRFETVCRDLEGHLYNGLEVHPDTNNLHKTEEGQPPFITSFMKTNCFDVLTDFLGNSENHTSFFQWRLHLYLISHSLQSSMSKLTQRPPGFSWKWGAELKAISFLSRILAGEVFKRQDFKDKTENDRTNILLGALFKCHAKSEKLMKIKKMPGATKKDTWSDFQARVETESTKLSEQQQLALALYMCLSSSYLKSEWSDKTYNERTILTIDAVERVYYQIKAGKHLKVQQTLSTWQRDEQGVDQGQVSYKYAMEVAPLCYSVVTCRLTKEMKIQMKEPGEITFCPVRHCRWCGQVETEELELFVCQFCKDIPEYPDVNLFCSLDCEEKTLDKKHREEHAAIIKIQLGMGDVEYCMDNLSLSSANCLDNLEQNYFLEKDNEAKEANVVISSIVVNDKELIEIETEVSLEGADAKSAHGD